MRETGGRLEFCLHQITTAHFGESGDGIFFILKSHGQATRVRSTVNHEHEWAIRAIVLLYGHSKITNSLFHRRHLLFSYSLAASYLHCKPIAAFVKRPSILTPARSPATTGLTAGCYTREVFR